MSRKRTLRDVPLSGLYSRWIVAALVAFTSCEAACADNTHSRMYFTGDILLSREVQREIVLRSGQSPWRGISPIFKNADWVMGNLEGSVGDAESCTEKGSKLCFAIQQQSLMLLKNAGFTALSIENNHSTDLGASGIVDTRSSLNQIGLPAIDFEHSPGFLKINMHVIAFVALTNVAGKSGAKIEIPSNELQQKIRLAKSLADWVIVNVHWGAELADWPQPQQRDMAKWMIEQGADVIIGHHPHVVQPPECILGKPVFFSLGNHVFDQKYPLTKQGLMAECTISSNQLSCTGVKTQTPQNSSFPELAITERKVQQQIGACKVAKAAPIVIDGYTIRPRLEEQQFVDGEVVLEGRKTGAKAWTVVAKRLIALEKGNLSNEQPAQEFLFTLENHFSSIDQEASPRPYVYKVSPHGLIAKWRGSALAWPLVDARLIRSAVGGVDYLCALHRADSFILMNQNTKETRTAVYQWNGFGFSGIGYPELSDRCEHAFNISN